MSAAKQPPPLVGVSTGVDDLGAAFRVAVASLNVLRLVPTVQLVGQAPVIRVLQRTDRRDRTLWEQLPDRVRRHRYVVVVFHVQADRYQQALKAQYEQVCQGIFGAVPGRDSNSPTLIWE